MSFLNQQFPTAISYGSQGGPRYSTTITRTGSGYEKRNANWSLPIHYYDVVNGVKDQTDLEELISFFHSVQGMAHGFRFKDWADYKSCGVQSTQSHNDQSIGTGDGTTAIFQIVKTYEQGALSTSRTITKPVSATVSCAIASVATSATVSYASGKVTFPDRTVSNITNIVVVTSTTTRISAIGHSFYIGDSCYFSSVVGMTEINGIRTKVLNVGPVAFDVELDVSGFSSYSSGGIAKTLPQTGEPVTAGYEFDVPCRFGSDELPVQLDDYMIGSVFVPVTETRNA